MIDPKEMLATLVDRFAVTAKVQNVFGEPIESHGKTIIPVARVSYRLGAGGGSGEKGTDSAGPRVESVAGAEGWFRPFDRGCEIRSWRSLCAFLRFPKLNLSSWSGCAKSNDALACGINLMTLCLARL